MRVSHSQGHTRRHQFQPGIITEPPAVSQSFPQASLSATGLHHLDGALNLTSEDGTLWDGVDGRGSPSNP
jgi:hypothetical protein